MFVVRSRRSTRTHLSGYPGGFDRSMQHHLKDLLFKDGVYDPEETFEAFSHARN
jgi:hypothetical protein